jgi:DmsE family decaheme c-type cytochrome
VCLTCHDDDSRLHWDVGAHAEADLACNACHALHVKRDPVLLKASESDICLDCHVEVKAAMKFPSRHPIDEDKTTCGTCHAPHGSSSDSMLRGFTLNDTCIGCHKDKRGPLLFEHEPVTEDCSLCHKPHGSVLPSLLTARPPFLCQECHQVASHPSRIPDGTAVRSLDFNTLAKGCVNCHSQVHGSNHPSGARLTR